MEIKQPRICAFFLKQLYGSFSDLNIKKISFVNLMVVIVNCSLICLINIKGFTQTQKYGLKDIQFLNIVLHDDIMFH